MRARLRHELSYRPFLALLGLGLFVRVATMAMYFPAWMQSADSLRFARLIDPGLFEDIWMPAGYVAFARLLRDITPELWVTVAVQHLIGLGVGIVLYLAVRRIGARPWLACVPAGVAFLSGDHIWLEHQIMSDSFMTALVAAGLASAVRGLVPRLDLRWLSVASALLMCAALSRNVALASLPVLVVCLLFWVRGSTDRRLKALAAAVLPAALVFGVYVLAFQFSGGGYLGVANMSGWNLYARVAPFADCTKFSPPPGTRRLCEDTQASERVGSLGYQWDPATIGRRNFLVTPQTSPLMGEFAEQAILHQPTSYLRTVGTDFARYFDSGIGPDRPYSGQTPDILSFGLVDPTTREFIVNGMSKAYSGTEVHVHGRKALADYQTLFRVGGFLLAAFFFFALLGMAIARGPVRLGVFLFGLTGLAMYLVPVATLSYDFRYGIPPETFIVVAGTLGFGALFERRYPGRLFDVGAVPQEPFSDGRAGARSPLAAAP